MFAGYDFEVIQRSLPYLFKDGMVFTLTLTAIAASGGIVFGTLLALMRLFALKSDSTLGGGYVNLIRYAAPVLVFFWSFSLVPHTGPWPIGAREPVRVGAFLSAAITF